MDDPLHQPSARQHWQRKFSLAGRGVVAGMRGQSSFAVHVPVAVAVTFCAAFLRCTYQEWAILILCIGGVIAMELMNSAIESMARAITREHNEQIGKSLDIASGAVLVTAIASAAAGLCVLVPAVMRALGGS